MNFSAYAGLQPLEVWRHFAHLNAIPRPSEHEEAARAYVQNAAQSVGAKWKIDARGNICVQVGARGDESVVAHDAPTVVLQSHLDMVCQKRPNVAHDFLNDPIVARREGDKIYASGTTLGADNGIGAAMMLAVLTSPNLTHPNLELLFTVEEETGLDGAAHLDADLVHGRLMINLDSEDPDEITVGCAGGAGVSIFLNTPRSSTKASVVRELRVSGLAGGHSGMQIQEPLANAISLMSQLLRAGREAAPGVRVISIDGGTAHNAIPRDCTSFVDVPTGELNAFNMALDVEFMRLNARWRAHEPAIQLGNRSSTNELEPLNSSESEGLISLLESLPHGVQQMSERFAGKVQTSSNLAQIETRASEIEIHVSSRSFLEIELEAMQNRVAESGRAAGGRIEVREGYPGWEPRADSPLLGQTVEAFQSAAHRTPHVDVVHAGLECGLLGQKLPGLDAVSFGPLIRGAHTPEEWVSIESTEEIWRVLQALLKSLA